MSGQILPQLSSVHKLVNYILKMCDNNSTTWSNQMLILVRMYGLPCPLQLMEKEISWTKPKWTCMVKTRITVYFERKMRAECPSNSSMSFLNE